MRRKRRHRLHGSAQGPNAHARTPTVADSQRNDLLVASVIVITILGFGAAFVGQIYDWMHLRYAGMVTVFGVGWIGVMVCGIGGSINVNGERIDRDQRPWQFWLDFGFLAVVTTGCLCLLIYSWLREAGLITS